MDRVRELNERISTWCEEHAYQIQQKQAANSILRKTLKRSILVAGVASTPTTLLIVYWSFSTAANKTFLHRTLLSAFSLWIFWIILAAAATAGGFLSFCWFWQSSLHQHRATNIIALAVAVIIFGWTVTLLGPSLGFAFF